MFWAASAPAGQGRNASEPGPPAWSMLLPFRVVEETPGGTSSSGARIDIMFVDLAWGGRAGEVRYPPLANGKTVQGVIDPSGQLIQQEHDKRMLHKGITWCRRSQSASRQPPTSMLIACAQRRSTTCRHPIQSHVPVRHSIPARRQAQASCKATVWRPASCTAARQACSFAL